MSAPPNHPAAGDDSTMHVQIVLDRSGSMRPIAHSTVDAINGFLAKQREQPGVLRISLADDAGIRQAMSMISEAVSDQRRRSRSERAQRKDTLFDEGDES